MFYDYEKFLFGCFRRLEWSGNVAKQLNNNSKETDLENVKLLAIRFIESRVTLKYGILGSSHYRGTTGSCSVYTFPNIYETCLLMPILKRLNIDPEIIDGLGTVVLKARKESGFWNFFQNVPDHVPEMFPDDIDDTSLCLYALLDHGIISYEECRQTATKMLESLSTSKCGPNGEWGVWLPIRKNQVQNTELKTILEQIAEKVRLDVVCLLNTLFLLAKLSMEDVPGMQASVKFLARYLDNHYENLDIIQPEMYYYHNNFVAYFFFSRYIVRSEYGKHVLGQRLSRVLQKALRQMVEQDLPKALNIACLILATIKMKLHLNGEPEWEVETKEARQIWKLLEILMKKLVMQQRDDGSFPEWSFYRWSKLDDSAYGGSEVVTTTFALAAINVFAQEKAKIKE